MAQTLKFTGYLSDTFTDKMIYLPPCETLGGVLEYLYENYPEISRLYYKISILGKFQTDKNFKISKESTILVICPFAGG